MKRSIIDAVKLYFCQQSAPLLFSQQSGTILSKNLNSRYGVLSNNLFDSFILDLTVQISKLLNTPYKLIFFRMKTGITFVGEI